MYYQILETLTESNLEACLAGGAPFAAVLTPEEWARDCAQLGMDLEPDDLPEHPRCSKAEVNYDSITGAFSIPNRHRPSGAQAEFGFAVGARCAIFVDASGTAQRYIDAIRVSKKWRAPCLERFLRDFLEAIVAGDLSVLERFERALSGLESQILDGRREGVISEINGIRRDLRALQLHYEQLTDLTEELAENENSFFSEQNLSHFQMFSNRVSRLLGMLESLQELTVQLRELYQSQLDLRQNHVTTVLTVVTTIFLPLTLIVGWYGMNFVHMPELASPLAYPIVIAVSLLIVIGCILFFKKKKLL